VTRVRSDSQVDRSTWRRGADVLGLVLVGGLVGWLLLSAAAVAGSRIGPIGTVLGSAAAYIVGRLVADRVGGRATPVAVLVVIVVLVLGAWRWHALLDREPAGGPLGYANADAALFVQALVASLILVTTTGARVRIAAATAATLIAACVVIIGSTAAVAVAAVVGGVASMAVFAHRLSISVILLGSGFLLSLLATVVLGAMYLGSGNGDAGVGSSTETRIALWHDALRLIDEHPLVGVGAGGFAEASPVAAADPDTRRTHNEFLQIGAETGVIAMLLLAAVFVWAILRTGLGPDPAPASIIAASSVAALGIHACVDYVLHFPLVPITAAVLAGATSIRRPLLGTAAAGTDHTRRGD
jgi:O-antigen ligase